MSDTGSRSEAALAALTRTVLADSPVVDGHNDLPFAANPSVAHYAAAPAIETYEPNFRTDLPRLRAGGVGAQFWSAYVPADLGPERAVAATLRQIALIRDMTCKYADALVLATTARDVRRARSAGRIASLIGLEGGHSIGDSLEVLHAMHLLGARYMTLTHTLTNSLGDSATDAPVHDGLSEFGRVVVSRMNAIGMLVDLSHVAETTMSAAIATSTKPVIFSHSACKSLCNSPRNVSDEVLAKLSSNGGVLMVTFVPSFVTQARQRWQAALDDKRQVADPPPVTVADVADHIDHARAIAGIDHVGLGSDFDGCSTAPAGLEDVSKFPALIAELLRRGYSACEVRKVAGDNVLRVLSDCEP